MDLHPPGIATLPRLHGLGHKYVAFELPEHILEVASQCSLTDFFFGRIFIAIHQLTWGSSLTSI